MKIEKAIEKVEVEAIEKQERVFRKKTVEETFIGDDVYEDVIERVLVPAKVLKLTPEGVEEVEILTRKDFLYNFSSFTLQDYLEDVKEHNLTLYLYEKDGKYTQAGPVNPEVLLENGFAEVSAEELQAEAEAEAEAEKNKKRVLEAQELTQQFNKIVEKYNKVKDELYKISYIEDDVEELERKIEKFSNFSMKEKAEVCKNKVSAMNQEIDSRYEALEKVLPSDLFDFVEELKEKYDVFNANDLCTVVRAEDIKKIVGVLKIDEIEEEECENHDIMRDVIDEIEEEYSEEIAEAIEKQEIEKFVKEYDNYDNLCILVINGKGEYENRYYFYDNIKTILKKDDQKIVAWSTPNWDFLNCICDNCEHDVPDENGDYVCRECKNKMDCIIDSIIAEQDYFEDLLEKAKKDLE